MQYNNTNRKYLEEREQDLHDLFEVSKRLDSLTNFDSIIGQMLLSLMGRLMIQKSVFIIMNEDKDELSLCKAKGLNQFEEGTVIKYNKLPEEFCKLEALKKDEPLRGYLESEDLEVLFPMMKAGRLMGLLAFGKRFKNDEYEKEEINYVSSLLSLTASSIENALSIDKINSINRGLDRKNQELQTLFELGKELNSTLDQETIVRQFGYALMGQMMVGRFLIYLISDDSLKIFHNKGFSGEHVESIHPCLKELEDLNEILLVQKKKDKLNGILAKAQIAAAIPLSIQGENKGVLCIEEKRGTEQFSDDDLQLLHTMGGQVIISLENARLFKESLERQRLQEELNIAREIQQGLLASDFNVSGGWKIFGKNVPSLEVGGDYFDVIKLDNGKIALAIADVSGKGAGASLLMSNLQASLRALVNVDTNLGSMVARINNILYQNTSADKYITFFIGILDPDKRTFTFCNAGHNPPLIFSQNGNVTELEEGGLIIGVMAGAIYKVGNVVLDDGDTIVMYTDGITEAENEKGEEFGEEGLKNHVKRNLKSSPEELINSIIEEVESHAVDLSAQDDVTLLIFSG